MRRYGSFAFLLALTACAAAPTWEKAGVTPAMRDRDLAACQPDAPSSSDEARRREARIAAARGEIGTRANSGYAAARGDLDASTQRRRDNKALADCMRSKGYTSAP